MDGQVAVITGGASGLGYALAGALARRGYRLALADISDEKARNAAAMIGSEHRGYGCDVTNSEQLALVVEAIAQDFGSVDLLFANAGVAIGGTLPETSAGDFDWMFDVNVGGVFRTVAAFLPLLRDRMDAGGRPRIVLTGSENAVGLPIGGASTAYTATKHAILGLADGLRRDLKKSGIAVSIFCPGLVNTRLWDSRAARQDRFGGAEALTQDEASQMADLFARHGQDPAVTAEICLRGLDRGEFLIITDPAIRGLAATRSDEVFAALDQLDSILNQNRPDRVGENA